MPKWNEALVQGKQIEYMVCNFIKTKYPQAYVVDGYNPAFDIFIPEIGAKIEVKQDLKANETGRFLVECEFDGKPSGISTSTANYWIFVDKYSQIWIRTEALRYIISSLNLKKFVFVGNGDTKEKAAVFIPMETLVHSPYTIVEDRGVMIDG